MTTVGAYLKALKSYEGVQESPRGSNRTPFAAMAHHANGLYWCATYQVGVARKIGLQLPPGADTASTAANEAAYKRAGRLSTTPRVGSVFFVYFPQMKPYPRVAHTGVVWKVAGQYVHTIEGNSNDDGSRDGYEVCLRKRLAHRAIGTVGIRSYGMPLYTGTVNTQEDDVLSKADRAALAKELADEIMHRLLTQPVVPNPGIRKGDPDGKDLTVIGALANIETNQDADRERYLKLTLDAVRPPR